MARPCSVCTHRERRAIERIVVNRSRSYRDIAGQFGLSKTAVSRHVNEGHIAEVLAKGHEAEQLAEADKLLVDIKRLQAKTLLMLGQAEKAGDLRTALLAVERARKNIELLFEVEGKINRAPTFELHLHPEWIKIEAAIVAALEGFPDAREAVARALKELPNGGG